MEGHSHDHLLHEVQLATHEVDDNRTWLAKSFTSLKRGVQKIIGTANGLTSVFAPRKDYEALIREFDTKAVAGSGSGSQGVTYAQDAFSQPLQKLLRNTGPNQFPTTDADAYYRIEKGISLLDNAIQASGARLQAVKLGFENAFGYRQADAWVEKYKSYVSATKFYGRPQSSEIGDALGITADVRKQYEPEHNKRIDTLLANLAEHAQTDHDFLSGTNGAAVDNKNGLTLLRALIDGVTGNSTDANGNTFEDKNAFEIDGGRIKNRREDLLIVDRKGQPILDREGKPRMFYEIDVARPQGAGILAGLLDSESYKRPVPGQTRSAYEAQRSAETAAARVKAPVHPAGMKHSLASQAPVEAPE